MEEVVIELDNNLLKLSQNIFDNYLATTPKIKYTKIVELKPKLESGKRPNGGVNSIKAGIPSIGAESIYFRRDRLNNPEKGLIKVMRSIKCVCHSYICVYIQ